MKKAFTFAELMISLVIISVITALLYPTISELAPNNNKHLFKTTYKTISFVVEEILNGQNETGAGNACTGTAITDTVDVNGNITTDANGNLMTATYNTIRNPHNLCCQFNNRLSTANMVDAAGNQITNCATGAGVSTLLQTSNGVRWWFNGAGTFYIDVNASNNSIASQCGATAATWANGSFCNNENIRDTFLITIEPTGKISAGAGEGHLRNETND